VTWAVPTSSCVLIGMVLKNETSVLTFTKRGEYIKKTVFDFGIEDGGTRISLTNQFSPMLL
jgi:hypothetical protein